MPVISEDFIRRFNLGDRAEVVIRDSRSKGFALRIRRRADRSLARTFFFVRELPAGPEGGRKRRKIVIGEHGTYDADKARTVADSMARRVQEGGDPRADRAAMRGQPTLADLAQEFEAHIRALKPGSQADYRGRIKRHILPAFKDIRVADLSVREVRDWHRERGKDHPTDANRILAVLSKMLSYAIELDWRKDNPAKAIKRNRERERDAWLDEHDLPLFLKALEKTEGPYSEILRFLLVTGWRISEARGLRWDMVDLKRLTAALPDSKTGAQVRALSADAATIVDRQSHKSGYVFSKRGTMPLDGRTVRQLLSELCTEAKIKPISPHALRHSAASWAAIGGASAHELREAFGWRGLAMPSRYVSRAESLARRGVERTADAINIFQKPSATVVDMAG